MPFSEQRRQFFPFELIPGVTARPATKSEVYAVTGAISSRVFSPMTELGLVPFNSPPPALAEQFSHHSEQFVFYDADDNPIGWSIGEQRQGDTYFMGWTGILPEWQRKGIYGAFLKQLQAYIASLGYARITSNHMVNNRSVLIAKLKAGFIVSGYSLDERIGAAVWLTWFAEKERAIAFEKAFSLESYDV